MLPASAAMTASLTMRRCSVITQTEICFSEQSSATYCFMVALLRARRSPATIAKSSAGTVKIAESHQPNPSTAAPSRDYVCRRKIEMTPGAQSRDDTPVGGGDDERRNAFSAESCLVRQRPFA